MSEDFTSLMSKNQGNGSKLSLRKQYFWVQIMDKVPERLQD